MNAKEINHYRQINNHRRENALKMKELNERLVRLLNNPDFVYIIQDMFCGSEIQKYIINAGDENLSKEDRANSLDMAMAGGHLARWIGNQLRTTQKAMDELAECDTEDEHLNQQEQ